MSSGPTTKKPRSAPLKRVFSRPVAISLSGGLASAASAIIAAEAGIDYEMYFADTLIEDEDLYRFNDDVAAFLGKSIHKLVDGRTPWQVFVDRRYIGNSRKAQCSLELKTKQIKRALRGEDRDLVLGMYLDEQDRLERAAAKWPDRKVRSLLIEHSYTPGDVAKLFSRVGIAQPRLYGLGFPHNNCGGMCVRAGQGQFAALLKHFPQRYAQHEKEMTRAMRKIGPTAKPFLRRNVDGKREYLTMKEFRLGIESGNIKPPAQEFGGCGCFTDD